MATRKGPTISDIAGHTGLSPATISLILNNKSSSFSPDTIERVQSAAQELGYTRRRYNKPNDRKKKIAIICPSVMNPYYAILIQGMEQVIRNNNCSSCIFTTYWDCDTEQSILDNLEADRFDGVIYAMIPTVEKSTTVYASRVPMVLVGDRHSSFTVDMAEINNYNGGVQIARHLIELGHSHIAYITSTLGGEHSARVRRLQGIQDTFAELCPEGSVHVREMKIFPAEELEATGIEHRVGYELARDCLDELEITAFAAINDMVAYGVLSALSDAGKRVPQDYSVSGFDNIYPSRLPGIQLTSIEHSIEKKGRWAARMLIGKILHPETGRDAGGGLMRVEYESFLVKGSTTAQVRKK